MKKIKVLEVIAELNRGGAETLLMNILDYINHEKYQIDFLCYGNKKFDYEENVNKHHGKIYRTSPPYKIGMFNHISEVKKFLMLHNYDVVHVHNLFNCGPVLLAAFLAGVKIRIAHSHNTEYLDKKSMITFKKKIYYFLAKILLNLFSTEKLACGVDAGKFLYFPWYKFKVVKNGIPCEKYKFNPSLQLKYRNMFNFSDNDFILGHVGRFTEQKNHIELINIFSEVLKLRPNSYLILIGTGEEEKKIKNYVKHLKIENNVKFLGVRKDVNKLYNMLDAFVFPSLFEGLPFTIIEAQCNGINIFLSDTITREVDLCGKLNFLSLNDPTMWAKKICEIKVKNIHDDNKSYIISAGYDIMSTVKDIEFIYRGED